MPPAPNLMSRLLRLVLTVAVAVHLASAAGQAARLAVPDAAAPTLFGEPMWLCRGGRTDGPESPDQPRGHDPRCWLACAAGIDAPAEASLAGAVAVHSGVGDTRKAAVPPSEAPRRFARYPSDLTSRGPPTAAS